MMNTATNSIYEKMDRQHGETLDALTEIKEQLAFQKGQQTESRSDLKAKDEEKGFWNNPIVVAVMSSVISAVVMGGLAAYFMFVGKP